MVLSFHIGKFVGMNLLSAETLEVNAIKICFPCAYGVPNPPMRLPLFSFPSQVQKLSVTLDKSFKISFVTGKLNPLAMMSAY